MNLISAASGASLHSVLPPPEALPTGGMIDRNQQHGRLTRENYLESAMITLSALKTRIKNRKTETKMDTSRNHRRQFLAMAGALGMAQLPQVIHAQGTAYPSKPIRMVVPFAAGGGTDILGRLLAQAMSQSMGQSVLVENITGAGGTIGAMQVARAAPDGYAVVIGTPGSIQINPAMQPDLRYSPDKDFAPVAQFSDSPIVLIVNKDLPWASVSDMLKAAQEKPGAINFGSAGVGSLPHFSAELFQLLAKIKLTHVPYRGSSQAITDLRAGRLQVQFENLPAVLGLIKGGQVRALAIGSLQRSSFLPGLPTIAEAGVPNYECSSWTGLFAPAATPPDILARIERAVREASQNPEIIQALKNLGAEPVGGGRADLRAFLARRKPLIEQTVKAADMSVN